MLLIMPTQAAFISALVVDVATEKRIIFLDASVFGFIALTTWDGSSVSARHAEPADAQIPSWSSKINNASDSIPRNVMFAVFARR